MESRWYGRPVTSRITGKNQVTIPAELVRREGMVRGTRLEWQSTDREHVLEVRVLPDPAALAASLQGRGRGLQVKPGSVVQSLIEERVLEDEAREERQRGHARV
jgi:hypothetical protein